MRNTKGNTFNPESLVTIRTAAGITQRDLSRLLRVSSKTVNYWERGLSAPRGQYIPLLVEIFHTVPEYFYYGYDPAGGRPEDPGFLTRSYSSFKAAIIYLADSIGLVNREKIDRKDFPAFNIISPEEDVVVYSAQPLPEAGARIPSNAICLSDDDMKMLILELTEYTEMRLRSITKKNTGKPFTLF